MNKNFTVILKRIIAVNSAKFAYAEIPLDDNLVIFGSGNLGKTSIVNAVRFFLLPELNLKNSDFKFGFISGKGESNPYFTKDQIYDHYFPTDDSRLILEVEHRLLGGGKQVHCQLISRGADYGLKRCFIPEPYSEIEHLFWDKHRKDAGAKPKILVGQKLLAELNKINPNTKQYSQYEQLTQALYKADILRPDTCPFVIFPLSDTKPSAIDSLRALVKMLFNQDERALRLMTATAIELRDQDDNVLALDIDSIIAEQADLRKRRDQLELFKHHEPLFIKLQTDYETLTQEQAAEHEFALLYANINDLFNRQNRELLLIANDLQKFKIARDTALVKCSDIDKDCKFEERTAHELAKKIETNSNKINKANLRISTYCGISAAEIIEILQEEIAKNTAKLEAFYDEDKKRARLDTYKRTLTQHENDLQQLIDRKDKSEFSLFNQLERHTVLTLAAVNRELAETNPKRTLFQSEIDSINNFSSLFVKSGSSLQFFDTTLPFFAELNYDDPALKIEDLSSEISRLSKDIEELAQFNSGDRFSSAKKIDELRIEIKTDEHDLALIRDLDHMQKSVEEQKVEYQMHLALFTELKMAADDLKLELQCCNDEVHKLESSRSELQNKQKSLDGILSRFNLTERFPNLQSKLAEVSVDQNFIFTDQCIPNLQHLSKLLESIKKAKGEVELALRSMITLRLIKDEYGLLVGNANDNIITNVFKSLSHKYSLLNEDTKVLDQAVKTHNEHFRNRLERLDKTRDRINLFIKQINDDLSHAAINDLEAVRLSVTLHPFFEDLVNSWREYDDLSSDGTLPEEWYSRLRTFLGCDAVNQTDKILRMENVIKSAGYETKKIGESWDNKAQSNSTKMLINTHLCEIFIQQLSDDENASVQFPVIMDEIGSVSSEQFPTLIKDLNARGRKLIGVTVHGKSGDVTAPFKNILLMDELLTSGPYSNNRRNVCFSHNIESVTRKLSTQDSLFGGDI